MKFSYKYLYYVAFVSVLTCAQSCRHQEEGRSTFVYPVRQEENLDDIMDTNSRQADCRLFQDHAKFRLPDKQIRARKGHALLIETEGLLLAATDTAVMQSNTYSVTSLFNDELPPLPQGMMNMTASAAGYRLLPGGEHFLPYAELRISYDPGRLPQGYTPDDIYTSFYDTATLAWVRLQRVEVDTINHEIVSLTSHFTDFINELLKAPDMPETQAFVPTAMNDLEAVSPIDGLTMIQPPTANNNGTASVSYPLVIPAGRGGMQPNLELNYSSGGCSGWLGIGWDIAVPSITLDTRWGVPRYNDGKETEIYLLNGEQLITKEADGTPRPLPHRTNLQTDRLPDGTQYYARTGDAHDSIIRHGDSTTNYWWEVVDRNGMTHYYGHYVDVSRDTLPNSLRDDNDNIARWPLCESRDLYGNSVRYYYDQATVKNRGAEGRQLYLDSISYTGHGDTDGYYTVVFCRTVNQTTDIPASCNNGFKEITDQVLNNIYVKYGDSILTAWLFELENTYESNYKNRLTGISKIDSASGGIRSFLLERCHCIRQDEDEDSISIFKLIQHERYDTITIYDTVNGKPQSYLGVDTIVFFDTIFYPLLPINMINTGYAGSTYSFTYFDAPDPIHLFGNPVRNSLVSQNIRSDKVVGGIHATALGLSHSTNWNVGGAITAGVGLNTSLSSFTGGGNYSYGKSFSETVMTLIDLDGDGLADKVYIDDDTMFFCKRLYFDNDSIAIADPQPVTGANRFMVENGHSNSIGAQISLGANGSANWTNSKSTTSVYFSDVNGDGLVDIVDNGQVLFNSVVNGVPSFSLFESDNENLTVTTSSSECGGIIFDGAVNDSIKCREILRHYKTETRKITDGDIDTFLLPYQNDEYVIVVDTLLDGAAFDFNIYHRELDCSVHDESMNTEAVRVWIAYREGIINVNSTVGLLEDTSAARHAARHADGITFSIQHSSNIIHDDTSFLYAYSEVVFSGELCETCYYHADDNSGDSLIFSRNIEVSQGDMLFFRLRSNNNHKFDNVYSRHTIEYVDSLPYNHFDSEEDFILSANYRFQAPVNGLIVVDTFYKSGSSYSTLSAMVGDTTYTYSGIVSSPISITRNIVKDSSVCFSVSSPIDIDWAQEKCFPHVYFYPDTSDIRVDSGINTQLDKTIDLWMPVNLKINQIGLVYNNPLYHRLFGPLYKGWGQFSYHCLDEGPDTEKINLLKLIPHDMIVSEAKYVDIKNSIPNSTSHYNTQNFANSESYEDLQSKGDFYNPLSYSSYWVEMTPDIEHVVWTSFGRENTIGQKSMSNSVHEEWFSSPNQSTDRLQLSSTAYDDPVPADSDNGSPAKAIRKENSSTSRNWSTSAPHFGQSYSSGVNSIDYDYMDLNGDRYPDIIGPEKIQYSQQWGGLGSIAEKPKDLCNANISATNSDGISFSASPILMNRLMSGTQEKGKFSLNSAGSASGNSGNDRTSGSWTDMNGDGLLDFVSANGNVYLNIGYGFLPAENWNVNNIRRGSSFSSSLGMSLNVWQGSIQAGVDIGVTDNMTDFMLMDINGDGLPDKIDHSSSGTSVSINLGNGNWSSPMEINADSIGYSVSRNESNNAGVTLGFSIVKCKFTVGLNSCPYGGNVNVDCIQLADINADGLPDLVSSFSEDSIVVCYNQCGKTNLLQSVINPENAVFSLNYTLSEPDCNQPSRSWLLTNVTISDSLNANNGPVSTSTEFSYATPHYDRYERMSLGYGTVITSQIEPSTGDTYRKVERNYYNNNLLRRGRLRRELTFVDSNTLYIEKIHECKYVDYANGDTVDADSECPGIVYPAKEITLTKFFEGGSTPLLVTGERTEYDRYHNIVFYSDLGDTAVQDDGVNVHFSYHKNLNHNLIGLRKGYELFFPGSSLYIRKIDFEYDTAHGKLTRQILFNGSDSSVYDFKYDAVYGNLDTAMQPENIHGERMTYSYTYDSIVFSYPVRINNSYGESQKTKYDYRFGRPISVTDPSGSTMNYSYDFAGRLRSVNSPLNTSGIPSLMNEYHPMNYYHNGLNPQEYTFSASPTHHPYSVSKHYGDDGTLITETAVLANGFGQPIQTKKGLKVDSVDMMQVSGRTVSDAFGRSVMQYDPIVELRSSHRGRFNTDIDSATLTATTYDVLDRTTAVSQPLGLTTFIEYGINFNVNGQKCFVTTTTDPNGISMTKYADYAGRQVQINDADSGITLMSYDNLGQLESSTDPEGFTTYYEYDSLGRLLKRFHPDANITKYEYDNAGNLIMESSPLGEVFYDYTYYRPLSKRYVNMTGNNAYYAYGTSGTDTGRPVWFEDGSGRYECHYDALGNVTSEERFVIVPDDSNAYRFKMNFQYDSWGRMLSMTYPDSEVVSYTYQWGGDLYAMHGYKSGNFRSYIFQTTYNTLGQKTFVEYGDHSKAYYSYDILHRLSNLTSKDRHDSVMQNIVYSFDGLGNIMQIHNAAGQVNSMGGNYTNYYIYDSLYRMVLSNGMGTTGLYFYQMEYSPSGRILHKQNAAASSTLHNEVAMDYGYCDKKQPHAVRRILDSVSGQLYDLRWDEAGNLGQISASSDNGQFECGRFLYWTEDNRMHTSLDDRIYTYYVYDQSGERRLKMSGENRFMDINATTAASFSTLDRTTMYPSAYMVLTNKGYTKHYYAGTERLAARIGGGGLNALDSVMESDPIQQLLADTLFKQCSLQVNTRYITENDTSCIRSSVNGSDALCRDISGIPSNIVALVRISLYRTFQEMVIQMMEDNYNGIEDDVYFYHGDHLGSASWITNAHGDAVQHLQYLPFGEPFVDQRATDYSERFTFTGKERDEETGYGYFGARYMDHELMTMWLSVDPMADKYPSISPYAYCAWNPVKLVDPDGRDVWELTNNGQLKWVKSSPNEKITIGDKSIFSRNPIIGKGEKDKVIDLSTANMSFGTNQSQAEMYFEFFADNLDFEFSLLGNKDGKETNFEVWTSLDRDGDSRGSQRAQEFAAEGKLAKHVHNHPNNIWEPSSKENHRGIGNDKDFRELAVKGSPNCDFYIYTKTFGGVYSKYQENGAWPQSRSRFSNKDKQYSRCSVLSPLQ